MLVKACEIPTFTTHLCILSWYSVRQHKVYQIRNICSLRFLVTQCKKHDDTKFAPRWNAVVGDSLLDTLWTMIKKPKWNEKKYAFLTLKSAPKLVANPCSSSPTSSSLSLPTSLLNSPTRATCLLTFPPSLRNSGYSSTKRFISEMELIEDEEWARERDWYCWT